MTGDPREALRQSWLDPEDDPARIRALRSHRRGGLPAPASLGSLGDRPAGVLHWPFETEVWAETHEGDWIPVGQTGRGPLQTPACRRLEVAVTSMTAEDHGPALYGAIRSSAISDLVIQMSAVRGLRREIYEAIARDLVKLPRLDRLTLLDDRGGERLGPLLERAAALPALTTLRVGRIGYGTPLALLHEGCPALERLEINNSGIRGADTFLNLCRLPVVCELDFTDSYVQSAPFRFDQEGIHPNVVRLSLQRFGALNRFAHDSLPSAFPNLESLDLAGIERTPLNLAFVEELEKLRELNIAHIDGRYLDLLTGLANSNIRSLNFAGNRVTAENAARLAAIPRLEELILHDCKPLSNRALAELAPLKRLKKLNLSNCRRITNRGLEVLPELSALETLELRRGWQITDRGLPALGRCRGLKRLGLAECAIGDDGIQELAELPLTTLNLWGCESLTDAALPVFAHMASLKQLNLLNCSGLSARALELLVAARPDMRIARPTGRPSHGLTGPLDTTPPHSRSSRY